jgi:3-methylfumaryl-CoA hydratase
MKALREGARIWRHSEISDVQVKSGRSGTLCFVTVDHLIEDESGPVIEERQDIVYRADATGQAAPRPVAPPTEAQNRRALTPTAPLLFRYSALTFNAHRIHYDQPYATSEEGYPGLVVQGPLQAALLCRFAEEVNGTPPRRFSFRGVAPLTGMAPFQLCAARKDRVMTLWTERDGAVSMMAEAEWS